MDQRQQACSTSSSRLRKPLSRGGRLILAKALACSTISVGIRLRVRGKGEGATVRVRAGERRLVLRVLLRVCLCELEPDEEQV